MTKETSVARELNAVEIDVWMSFGCSHGIFADEGFGNYYHVQQAEGRHTSAIHMDTQRSVGLVTYAEGGTKPVIDMQGAQNAGIVIHAGGSTSYEELFNIGNSYRLC